MEGYNEAMQDCSGSVANEFLEGIIKVVRKLRDEPNYEIIKSTFEKEFGFEIKED